LLLTDKVAIVSGVGPGLGQRIAVAFAREGADVVLGARTESYLEEVAGVIEGMGRRALPVPTNIAKADDCARIVERALDTFGRIDCLVNCAFRPDVFQRFEDVDLALWRKIYDVNVFGTLQLTQQVIAPMKSRGGGSIVFIGSMSMRKIRPMEGAYASSKGALMTAAQTLAKELGQYNIRVNSVVPGWMMGPPVEFYLDMMAGQNGTTRDEEYAKIVAEIPLGYIPPDEDCANAVVYFASDLSSVVTGQALDVNGGEFFH
jgi:NAD(P)-dependent dehydrogenase (short-subunit alcohol dehydrogenase family)